MLNSKYILSAYFIIFTLLATPTGVAEQKFITVASTTSTANSGLFDYLLPLFSLNTGIRVHVIAVGTGKAIKLAERGDADILFVHHTPSEKLFVSLGHGLKRYDVMYNDFVLVGPSSDPKLITRSQSISNAFKSIAQNTLTFISRGDHSGTNKKELTIWNNVSINPRRFSGTWYRETGSGMGATLNITASMEGYTLTDRATWLSFKNKANLKILFEGDQLLFNQYGIILVNPKKHPHIKTKLAQTFINWITSKIGQRHINNFKIDGKKAFFPNARTLD